jgi:hypothetical protein
MGYYTRYNLSTPDLDLVPKQNIIKIFREEYKSASYALDADGDSNDECKWYEAEKELIEFSIKHPSILFLLEGVGEENGDEWKLYVQDGHSQKLKAKMVFPPFDKAKLQSDIRESKINKVLN